MKSVHLICVGKLKDSHLEAIEAEYLKRIVNPPLTIHEVKSSAEDKNSEGEALLKKLKDLGTGLHVVAMTEWGTRRTSVEFAKWTQGQLDKSAKLVFLIAGAEGFNDAVLSHCQERVSLSELTFPHKLARILLVEQLYRAQTIRMRHPYHN